MKISLIMTVYNREHFLSQAIESALKQTFADFEFLIWDDGSEDSSLAIARDYACQDRRIKVFAGKHQGRAKSLVDVHANAKGEYVGWIDSDDLLEATALAQTVAVLGSNPEIGMVYSDHKIIDQDGKNLGPGRRCQIPYSAEYLLLDFMTFQFRLIRRSAFMAAGKINPNFKYAEDYDLCLRISEITQITHLKKMLYAYRVHANSISKQHQLEQVKYAGKAVNEALIRRGMADEYELNLQIRPRFSLKRKGYS